MLNTDVLEDEILTYLRTELDGIAVYDTEVPDTAELPQTNGTINPYVVVSFAGGFRSKRDAGLCGYSRDVHVGNLSVQSVAVNATDAKILNNKVTDCLTDWKASDTGAFELTGILGSSNASGATKPTRFFRYAGFRFPYNL